MSPTSHCITGSQYVEQSYGRPRTRTRLILYKKYNMSWFGKHGLIIYNKNYVSTRFKLIYQYSQWLKLNLGVYVVVQQNRASGKVDISIK